MVTITSDNYVTWREGLISHAQDILFWSFWASSATPLLAENEEIIDFHLSQDKPPVVISGSNLNIGKRKNLMVINSKKQRADHLLKMHQNQVPDPNRAAGAPYLAPKDTYTTITSGHRYADFAEASPMLKCYHKPPLTITDQPSFTTAHAKLAVTLVQARDELWIEHEGFSDRFQEKQWSTITSKRGTAVIPAGDWLGIAGTEKFKLAPFAQQRDLLVTQAQQQQLYTYTNKIKGFQIRPVYSRDIRYIKTMTYY